MTVLSLSLLGPFEASLGREPLRDFRTRKVQALLIYLAAEPEAHSRDRLFTLLWPGLPDKSARSNLRQILYYLRQAIPEARGQDGNDVPVVIANRQKIRLSPQADVTVDTWRLETLLDGVHAHEHLDLFLCPQCAGDLREAVALYRGDFLSDFYLDDSNAFEAWAQARREYFRRRVLDALGILTTMAIRAREFAEAQAYAEKQLEIDNLRESAYRQLMEVLALSGRREQALALYENCRRVLAEELGMAPSARTSEMYEKIMAGDLDFHTFRQQGVRGYELKEQIGEGAHGTIHRAIQPHIGREVAVKVIRRQYADDPEFIRRFEAEAQTVARLEHPYIVPLYDYWRDPHGAYLVMRYMRHGSLLSALKSGPWDPPRAASLVTQVADALAIAHRQDIVHRDIKPGNILLDAAGNAYLTDFGIAKDLGRQEPLTGEHDVVGTLDYASPEQITSETVTPQSDIYSLGAVLYETLTGEKPFADGSVAKLLHDHLNTPMPMVTATRPDVPVAVDDVLQKATAKKPAQRYATVLDMAGAFARAAGGLVPERPPEEAGPPFPVPDVAEVYNPYKGLRPFQEADADDFFGRDDLIQQLIERLGARANGQEARFLALVGPSGSGKSSTVKAGLIPALRGGALPGSESWFVAEMVPGAHPLEELEVALWPVAVDPPPSLVEPMQRDTRGLLRTLRRILPDDDGSRSQLLLVIDQFEELFTLVEDEERRAFFLDSLLAAMKAPRSPLRVLVTLRADFYDRPLLHQEWGRLLKENTEIVLPLNHSELTWAVREPARRMGVRLEEELVATIVGDVTDQLGALPLLQYALTELFERREGKLITRAAYREIGGVQGALGRRAEALYEALDERGREAARQLFLRLVTLGEGIEDTRRRILRSEVSKLAGERRAMEVVLERFGKARLLTFDRDPLSRAPTVEVAHEALLREWSRLRRWLAESRDDVRLQRLLARAAGEWVVAEKDDAYLLRGSRLDQFGAWVEKTPLALTQDEKDFLSASLEARTARQEEEEARRRRELETARQLAETEKARADEQVRATSRLRRLAVGLAIVFLVAVVAALVAIDRGQEAQSSADAAATSAAEAVAEADQRATAQAFAEEQQALAVAESQRADEERDAAIAAEATAVAEGLRAEEQRRIAEELARLATSRELSLAALNNLDVDPELSVLLALQALENAETKHAEEALHAAMQAARVQLRLPHDEGPYVVAYSPDGRQVATASSNDAARVWDLETGAELLTLPLSGEIFNFAIRYDVEGTRLAVWSRDEALQNVMISAWDTLSGAPAISVTLPITTDGSSGVALSPDWSLLAMGYEHGTAALWDVQTAENLVTLPASSAEVTAVRFSADGARLMLGGGNEVSVWEVSGLVGGDESEPLAAFTSEAGFPFAAISDDGERVALGAVGGDLVEVWELSSLETPLFSLVGGHSNTIFGLDFSVDGSLLAVASADGKVTVWGMDEGRLLYTLAGHAGALSDVAFSPDRRTLATVSVDGTARIWDAGVVADGEITHYATHRVFRDLELSPAGDGLALGGSRGSAVLLTAATGEQLLELASEPGTAVYRVAFRPDGRRLAAVGEDNVIRVWDRESGEVLRAWTGHGEGSSGGVYVGTIDVVYSPDGNRLATAGTDGVAKVWHAQSGEELLALRGHTAGLHSIAYSPDGRWIATSSDYPDSTVKVWEATVGALVHTLEGHPARAWALAFSPDSSLLATGGFGGVVKLWDLATGNERYTLPSQVNTVLMIRFTPDGKKMITGGDALRVWDVDTGTELLTLSDRRTHFDVSPDGRYLYAGHFNDGVIRVYALILEDLMEVAHERLTRWWTPEECQRFLSRETCPPRY